MAPTDFDRFASALRSAGPLIETDALIAEVDARSGLSESVAPILRMLMSMLRASEGDREPFAAEVVAALRPTFDERERAEIDWEESVRRLADLLGCDDSLGVTAKIEEVRTDHERVFCMARILSDIRPVFGRDPTQAPVAGTVIHMLRIDYHEGSYHHHHPSFYVALDSRDLRRLAELVTRAIKKEASLKNEIERTSMKYLDVETE